MLPNRKDLLKGFITALLVVAICAWAFFVNACTPRPPDPVSTGVVIPSKDLPGIKGDTAYGQVNSAWLHGFYARWHHDLFEKGVTKWEERFDCNRFASHYQAAAQIEYYVDNFHSWTPGRALALAEVWYKPDRSATGHAIVEAYTENGAVYIEPQTGRIFQLTAAEKASVYFRRF